MGVLEGRVGSLGGVGVLGVLGEDSRQRDLSAVVIMEPRSGGRGFLEPNIGFLSVAALVIMGIGGGADRDRGEGEGRLRRHDRTPEAPTTPGCVSSPGTDETRRDEGKKKGGKKRERKRARAAGAIRATIGRLSCPGPVFPPSPSQSQGLPAADTTIVWHFGGLVQQRAGERLVSPGVRRREERRERMYVVVLRKERANAGTAQGTLA